MEKTYIVYQPNIRFFFLLLIVVFFFRFYEEMCVHPETKDDRDEQGNCGIKKNDDKLGFRIGKDLCVGFFGLHNYSACT